MLGGTASQGASQAMTEDEDRAVGRSVICFLRLLGRSMIGKVATGWARAPPPCGGVVFVWNLLTYAFCLLD